MINPKEDIMSRKGQMPKHIQKKIFHHPQPELRLIQILENIEDPRKPSCNFQHSLTSIVFIVIVTSLCGADEWPAITEVAESIQPWISRFVDVSSGIPSSHTIERVFSLMSPELMEQAFIEVMKILKSKKEGVISFDGKTLRGTSTGNGKSAIHLLNAWSVENGICIGQRKVDEHSNEITAIPKLMELLDLKETIVTTDALNTQKEVAAMAIQKKADYFLPVKGNHKGLLEEIDFLFQEAKKREFRGIDADQYETLEKSHGRVEKRTYYSMDAEELSEKTNWAGIKSLGKVIRERTVKEKTSIETILYISSCEVDAKLLARCSREHWQVENALHWSLDVILREDKLRYRHKVGARNLATIRKIILGTLGKDKTRKCGRAGKRTIAASDPLFREEILKNLF
jgi:predicted transposase YbfD/YdcC